VQPAHAARAAGATDAVESVRRGRVRAPPGRQLHEHARLAQGERAAIATITTITTIEAASLLAQPALLFVLVPALFVPSRWRVGFLDGSGGSKAAHPRRDAGLLALLAALAASSVGGTLTDAALPLPRQNAAFKTQRAAEPEARRERSAGLEEN